MGPIVLFARGIVAQTDTTKRERERERESRARVSARADPKSPWGASSTAGNRGGAVLSLEERTSLIFMHISRSLCAKRMPAAETRNSAAVVHCIFTTRFTPLTKPFPRKAKRARAIESYTRSRTGDTCSTGCRGILFPG